MKNEVNLIVKERYKSLESIDKDHKDSSDSFNKEYETLWDEYHDIKSIGYDFIHLLTDLKILLTLYRDIESKNSETDKIHTIKRVITIIQCLNYIMEKLISNVFSHECKNEYE